MKKSFRYLPTSQWLLKAPAKFLKQKKRWPCSSQEKQLQPNWSISTAGFITNRRKLTLLWSSESDWKGYIFIKMCVGRACKTSPCLLQKRQKSWAWTYFQVPARRSMVMIRWPQTACLNEDAPRPTHGTTMNLLLLSLSTTFAFNLPNIFPNKTINTFTYETNYDRTTALPAFSTIELLRLSLNSKTLFLSH